MNFFKIFWSHIGEDFCKMIRNAVSTGRFPSGVTKGLITLIPKSGDLKLLTNWRPITLLNVSYKIYAKALQIRLQEPLAEIVSLDQCAYLRNRFILDNILLTHETLAWAKKSRQDTIFLKLDFSKAFHRVDWSFLFNTMEKWDSPLASSTWSSSRCRTPRPQSTSMAQSHRHSKLNAESGKAAPLPLFSS